MPPGGLLDQGLPGRSEMDPHDSSISDPMLPGDQSLLNQSAHQPRHVAGRHEQLLGDLAHRQGTFSAQNPQDTVLRSGDPKVAQFFTASSDQQVEGPVEP